jgi:phage/plasmid-associated DNA primase
MQLNQKLKPGELPFKDCILNVLTHEKRPITPADMLTDKLHYKAPGRAVDPRALADVKRIVEDVFPHESERTRLMKEFAEALFTGRSVEKYMVQIVGQGDNGKTTFNSILFECFPQFVEFISVDNLLKQDRGSNKHSDWLTDNKAKRIIGVEEPPHGAKLDNGLMKEITGNGVLTARGIYGKPFNFYAKFRIFMMTISPVLIPNAGVADMRRRHTFRAPCEFVAHPDPTNPLSKPRDANLLVKFEKMNNKVAVLYYLADFFRLYLSEGFSPAPEDSNYLVAEVLNLADELWKVCEYGDAKKDAVQVKILFNILAAAGYTGSKTSLFEDLRNMFARDRQVKCLTTDRNYRVRGLRFKESVFQSPAFRQFD